MREAGPKVRPYLYGIALLLALLGTLLQALSL